MVVNRLFFEPTALCLSGCFNRAFSLTENTVLEGGANEPYYRPGSPNVIYFREDYSRSALHEVAHWCVAGAARRGLPDYGYWYAPDGRDEAQQAAFYGVEVRPQAIEKMFCEALGIDFKVSVDNCQCRSRIRPLHPSLRRLMTSLTGYRGMVYLRELSYFAEH